MATKSPSQMTDAELLHWGDNFQGLTTASPATYGLTAAQADTFLALLDDYRGAFDLATEPSTRTGPAVAAKNTARDALRDEARRQISIVDGQAGVSPAQRLALGLNVRKPRPTPSPRPTSAPLIEVQSGVGNNLLVRLLNAAAPGRRGRPEGVIGATLFSYVGEAPAADESAWTYEGNVSRRTVTLAFGPALPAGTKVWVTAFWYNRRAESGPPAAPVSATLQGGAAMAA